VEAQGAGREVAWENNGLMANDSKQFAAIF